MLYLGAMAGLNAVLAAFLWPIAGGGLRTALWLSLVWAAGLGAASAYGLGGAAWMAAAGIAAAVGALLFSPEWRAAVREMPGCRMISANLLRVPYGAALLLMGDSGLLPAEMAQAAGMGAIVVGMLAPLAVWAIQEDQRWLAVLWNLLSLADLGNSIRLGGAYASSGQSLAVATAFDVPALAVLHLYLFWKLTGWSRIGRCDSAMRLAAER